ncbi:helix-turn-helix transcriptional regulator [Solimonas marina]|uniref:Helix-turn-helix transcriptional regulator n=1 Tax=Solimonas marina TaxID=2714601 RepID=A0A969W752_9GAMM|nr:helix-turn-helix transcriptional regulator [Solimonas marina]NKF20830.1 helix-turn-helix transcriptional regulator [Solimonas marina]
MSQAADEARIDAMHGFSSSEAGQLAEFERLNQVFTAIYEGASEDPPLRSSLQALRELFDAKHATLILRPATAQNAGAIINSDTVNLATSESYRTHFHALDPFVDLPDGQVVTPEELMGSSWQRSMFYRQFLEPVQVGHLIGADLHLDSGVLCRFRVSRDMHAAPFSENDKLIARMVLPHIKRALQLHVRLDDLSNEHQLFAGTLNRLQLGTISIARDGTVIDLNPEAQRIVGEHDGLLLRAQHLSADSATERRELQRVLRQALEDRPRSGPSVIDSLSISRPSGRGKLCLVVRTVPRGLRPDSQQSAAAVVFLRDPEAIRMQGANEVVRRLFNFTRMEAALALLLADGLTLDEAAEKLGVRRNTARTYLRFIFCKTGVTRQTLLVRMLLNNIVSLA